ncbi:MAG: SOS response-associated peptidase [Pseudomonadota bacterium]
MCNLYSCTTAPEAMRQLFEVDASNDHLGNAEPRPAIFPKYPGPVVWLNDDGDRELVSMNWGFLTKNISKKTGKELKPQAWNNARDDKVRINGLWKGSFENRRCLIPASAFHEAKGRNPAVDHWFGLSDRSPFAFAGLWRDFQPGLDGDHQIATHTMVTTVANDLVRPVHPTRMPVILEAADYGTWLSGPIDEAFALLRPYPPEKMQIIERGVRMKAEPPFA